MNTEVRTPPNCSGPWSECKRRNPSLTEAQWHRGQMRGYAGFWRRRGEIAALVGDTVGNVARVDLSLAKVYRDEALRIEKNLKNVCGPKVAVTQLPSGYRVGSAGGLAALVPDGPQKSANAALLSVPPRHVDAGNVVPAAGQPAAGFNLRRAAAPQLNTEVAV